MGEARCESNYGKAFIIPLLEGINQDQSLAGFTDLPNDRAFGPIRISSLLLQLLSLVLVQAYFFIIGVYKTSDAIHTFRIFTALWMMGSGDWINRMTTHVNRIINSDI